MGGINIKDTVRDAASKHLDITGEESPAFHAAVYLENTAPQEYERNPLIASLAVLLGAGLSYPERRNDRGLVTMVKWLNDTAAQVYDRLRGDRDIENDGQGIDDLSTYGCFELLFHGDLSLGDLSAVMIKTPFARPEGRCQQ